MRRYKTIILIILIILSSREFQELDEATIPEIQRSNLTSVILTMMNIGIENVQNFDFMDAPGSEDIVSAVRQLRLLGACVDAGAVGSWHFRRRRFMV